MRSKQLSALRTSWWVVVAVLSISGCGGDGLTRVVVVGTVMLKDQPVEDGQIRFIPDGGTVGPLSMSPIRQGQYRCDVKGGVPIGNHRVEILVWDPNVPPPSGPGGDPRPQWAPEKYNKQSTLTAEVDTTSDPLVRDFRL